MAAASMPDRGVTPEGDQQAADWGTDSGTSPPRETDVLGTRYDQYGLDLSEEIEPRNWADWQKLHRILAEGGLAVPHAALVEDLGDPWSGPFFDIYLAGFRLGVCRAFSSYHPTLNYARFRRELGIGLNTPLSRPSRDGVEFLLPPEGIDREMERVWWSEVQRGMRRIMAHRLYGRRGVR